MLPQNNLFFVKSILKIIIEVLKLVQKNVDCFTSKPRAHGKVKVSHYRSRRSTEDVDARIHIYTSRALGRGRVASPTLDRLYPRGEPPVLIL